MIAGPASNSKIAAISEADGRPEKPSLVFRVGITGARKLAPEVLDKIRGQIEAMLKAVAGEVTAACTNPKARKVYRLDQDDKLEPKLRALSPLADGADRLFADVATKLGGYVLDAAFPFAREDYANDFKPDSRADFQRWLEMIQGSSDSACVEIDGGRERDLTDEENRSYEAVGRLVARNCDLLVAIWDGRPAKGRGGTAEIVRFAASIGPPVWWIDAAGQEPPRLIRTVADLRWSERTPRGDEADRELRKTIADALIPPGPGKHGQQHGLIGLLAHWLGLQDHVLADPLRTYLSECGRPRRFGWQAHKWFFRLVAGTPGSLSGAPDNTGSFWERQYEPADATSVEYRDRYRSSYVLIFLFATLAVACAVISLAFEDLEPFLAPLELLWLLLITSLVALNQNRDWQGRWIAYRLLAELCRKQEALALLGWSLPASDLRVMGKTGAAVPWVGWYFNALLRAAPLATGRLVDRLPEIRTLICAKLVAGQEGYHKDRKELSRRAAHRLSQWGEVAFLVTCAIVLFKLLLVITEHLWHAETLQEWVPWLGVSAAILPAVSAALFGIRAYAELELLEQQSARLEETMQDAGERIRSLRLDHPLASQDLAEEVFDLSAAMLQDVSGWATLFQLKKVEAG